MTAVGAVIPRGQSIPDDVIRVLDMEHDAWSWVGAEVPTGLWQCENNQPGDVRSGAVLSESWGPLTVTAVRQEPASLANLIEGWVHQDGTECPEYLAPADGRQWWCTTHEMHVRLLRRSAPAAESVDLLDLVRQYGVMHSACVGLTDAGAEEPARQHHEQELALFARIEAEVDRLRGELTIEREAEERCNAELTDIVRRLDEAEVDSGGASERVGYAIQSMQRGWSTAKENLARLDTVKADRETVRGALNHLKDTVTRPAIKALGVQHNEEIVPAIERLKDDLRAVDDLVQDDLMQRAAPDPLVLSLPSVPDGATLVSISDLATVLKQRVMHSHLTPGVWDDSNRPELAGKPCVECAARARLAAALPPPREPRTWPAFDITEPEDRPNVVDVEGHGRWRLGDAEDGDIGHPDYYWSDDDGERDGHLMYELRQLGEVTEVFDEDGTQ